MPLVFLLLALSIANVHATMLVNRQQYLSTKVLPRGLWTFGVSHGRWTNAGNSYSGTGSKITNNDYFSRAVDYSALSDEIGDPLERELARAAFEVYDRNDNQIAGYALNDVSVNQQSNTYILGRGLSNRSSVFIVVPVVTLRTRVRSRFVGSESLNQFANQLRADGQYAQAEEIIENTRNALHDRLNETGYSPNYPTELTTVANVMVTHRYQLQAKRRWDISADSSLVVPAGKKSGPDDFLYLRLNEEQYSARQAMTVAYLPSRTFEVLASTYYHARFPFERSRRIPLNNTSPLSADIDNSTRVRYGDTWGVNGQVNYAPSDSFSLYLGHIREYKASDRVSGDKFASSRYSYLEQNTTQRLATTYLGTTVNTIRSFLAQDFIVPVDLNLQYSFTNSGQNAFAGQAIAATLMVFYK